MRLTIETEHPDHWTIEFCLRVTSALQRAFDRFPDTFTLDGNRLHWRDGTSGARVNAALWVADPTVRSALYLIRTDGVSALARAVEVVAQRYTLPLLPVVEEEGRGVIDANDYPADLTARHIEAYQYINHVQNEAWHLNAYTDEQLGGM